VRLNIFISPFSFVRFEDVRLPSYYVNNVVVCAQPTSKFDCDEAQKKLRNFIYDTSRKQLFHLRKSGPTSRPQSDLSIDTIYY
jgi:hypothetical protein